MKLSTTSIIALAALASATPNLARRQSDATTLPAPTATVNRESLLAILASVLPTSLVNEALTNSDAVASDISSEFAAGKTPSWFMALPTSVQAELIPLETLTQAPAVFLSALPTAATTLKNLTFVPLTTSSRPPFPAGNFSQGFAGTTARVRTSSAPIALTSTTATSVLAPSVASTTRSSSSSGVAALPSPIVGGGIAGLIGIVGVLAL